MLRFAFALSLAISAASPAFADPSCGLYQYKAVITEIYDGDTVTATLPCDGSILTVCRMQRSATAYSISTDSTRSPKCCRILRSSSSFWGVTVLSVSDILKILDQVPIWRTLRDLPKRVEALEQDNAALKEKLDKLLATPASMPGEPCPACGENAMRRTKSVPTVGHFAGMGLRDETWTCSACGETDVREMQSAR